MTLEGRAALMARSLETAARRRGSSDESLRALGRAFAVAMGCRIERIDDDHHPAYLHPGRSPLLLLHDVGSVDVAVLIVAAIHESFDAHLRSSGHDVEEALGPAAAAAVASIPLPGDERLVERLLALGPGVSLSALAERLDHLRHLHLRDDLVGLWADTHDEVVRAWLPFAQRTHPKIAVRFAHWARTFSKRI